MESQTFPKQDSPFEAMRIPEFRNLVVGRFLFILSLRMMSTLVGWWIYKLTSAPFAIGLIGLNELLVYNIEQALVQ